MTGLATGWQTVWGIVEESTYGTPLTVARFHEIYDESLELKTNVIKSAAMRPGAYAPELGAHRAKSSRAADGTVKLDIATKGMGILLKHITGATPTIVQQGGTAAYLHTYTLASIQGKSLTLQKQIRDAAGSVLTAFTYPGSKITKAEFSIGVDNMLTASVGFDCQDERTNIAAATPSYLTTAGIFTYAQGTVKFNGSALADSVTDAMVSFERPMNVDRRGLGNQGLKLEPQENGFPKITGKLSSEFTNQAAYYDRYVADTSLAFVLEFVGNLIATTYYETFRITIPDIRLTGETPKAKGPDTIGVDVPFEASYDGTNNPFKIELITTDVAA